VAQPQRRLQVVHRHQWVHLLQVQPEAAADAVADEVRRPLPFLLDRFHDFPMASRT
jgi:hypothetical protein